MCRDERQIKFSLPRVRGDGLEQGSDDLLFAA
jgi:hypothetical protein